MRAKRLLFSSWHNYLDPSNGASITAREILLALARRGWKVVTFCGPTLDFRERPDFMTLLDDHGITPGKTVVNKGLVPFRLVRFRDHGIKSTVFLPRETSIVPSPAVGNAFLRLFREHLAAYEPDLMMTYGGYWMGRAMLESPLTRRHKNTVLLMNCAYDDAAYFENVDLTLVLSEFSANYYRDKIGLRSTAIAPLMDWSKILVAPADHERKYLTFINPDADKGLYFFVAIAEVLAKKRPDIPILLVGGRGGTVSLGEVGERLRGLTNLHFLENTPSPRRFYGKTKILLVPSVFQETFGRVAAEAMMNGIPVIGSDRGALPETIGEAGILLDIPSRITPQSREISTEEEVTPWIRVIQYLWDDADLYDDYRRRGLERAKLWDVDTVASQYDRALGALT